MSAPNADFPILPDQQGMDQQQEQEAAVSAGGAASAAASSGGALTKAPPPPTVRIPSPRKVDAAVGTEATSSSSSSSTTTTTTSPRSDDDNGPTLNDASSMDVAKPPDESVDQQPPPPPQEQPQQEEESIVDRDDESASSEEASFVALSADQAAGAAAAAATATAPAAGTAAPSSVDRAVATEHKAEEEGATAMAVVDGAVAETPRAPNGFTVAEVEAYLSAALAMQDAAKRMKLVGKGLVALEATLAALGSSPDAAAARPLHQQATAAIAEWRLGLGVGSEVDAQSFRDDKWYSGNLQEGEAVDKDEEEKKGGPSTWVVKFKRFSVKHNEAYGKAGADLLRFMPVGSHTAPLKGSRSKKRPLGSGAAGAGPVEGQEEGTSGGGSAAVAEPELQVVGTTRFGRAVKSAAGKLPAAPSRKKRKKEEQAAAEKEGQEAASAAAAAEKPSEAGEKEGEKEGEGVCTAVDTEGKDYNDWVCGMCHELERSDKDRLVLCDGPCHGAFHQSCLGLSSAEVDAMAEWFCEQCLEGAHTCFVCGDTGQDDGVNGGVHKCSKAHCGKFYHQHCLSQLPHAQIAKQQGGQQGPGPQPGQEEEGGQAAVKFKFTCPLHVCDLCGKGRETGARAQLWPCWHCPKAYHTNCIPPTSKYHEYLLLCPEHAHLDLPRLPNWDGGFDDEDEGQGEHGDDAAAAAAVARGEGWLAGMLCALLPRSKALPFRLPRSAFNDVHSKPRPYSHIPCLKYLCKIPLKEPGPECQCQPGQCDERCLNRILHIECVGGGGGKEDEEGAGGGGAGEGGGGGGSSNGGRKEKYHNCNAGPGCGNRQFRNKEYIKHQIFKEGGCGWGLRTLEDVRKGQLVFEYVGEVIDDDMLNQRLEEHARDHPNDHNMYIMELESGYYLDARVKGNASRFINHSCAPNCELQKWNVKGYTRIGIMANQDIPAGTPLSYDYQARCVVGMKALFATNEEGKFQCHCGAATCRGSLAPKPKCSEDEEMEVLRRGGSRTDRKKLLELVRKRREREASRKEQAAQASARKKNLTSRLLPGDPLLEVRAGPPPKYFHHARAAGLFLVRNAKRGSDFLRRQELMGVAAAAAAAAPAAEADRAAASTATEE